MPDAPPIFRSPELMSPEDALLVVVDMQVKLLEAIRDASVVIWNCQRLIQGAVALGLPVLATEQYPAGLGPTVPGLGERLGPVSAKRAFSCLDCPEFRERLASHNRHQILIAGIEAHVCVLQTALDLLAGGYRVYLAVDAIGSRSRGDLDIAVRRMESAGCSLTSTEAALFEWCRTSDRLEFKAISALVRKLTPQ